MYTINTFSLALKHIPLAYYWHFNCIVCYAKNMHPSLQRFNCFGLCHNKKKNVMSWSSTIISPTLHLVLNLFCYQGSTLHLKKTDGILSCAKGRFISTQTNCNHQKAINNVQHCSIDSFCRPGWLHFIVSVNLAPQHLYQMSNVSLNYHSTVKFRKTLTY